MRSVGIDIGTSTTQVALSELTLENTGGYFSAPQIAITQKRLLYRGEIHETPLLALTRIDTAALRRLVEEEFRRAGLTPGEMETGAVIITGESARKENAAAVLEQLSGFAGEFVITAAGPDLEALIAGQGSGAQALSARRCCRVANLDIGGGTTNIAVFSGGEAVAMGCYDIGGRHLRFAPDGALTCISQSAQRIAHSAGLALCPGQVPSAQQLLRLAQAMARLLEDSVTPGGDSPLLQSVRTAGSSPLALEEPVDLLCFSGGVADCVYQPGRERFAFGDFGVLLGEALRISALCCGGRLAAPLETIRATVLGAGMYTTALSGSTIRYTGGGLFPIKNLPVFAPGAALQEALFAGADEAFRAALSWFLRQHDAENAAIALEGKPCPGYQELKRLARAISAGAERVLPPQVPLVVLLFHDFAKALGQMLIALAPGRSVIALDGIRAGQNHFVDLGKPQAGGLVVPVAVKTLLLG
jgi:ethanolamine utilization protein EutA